ncbi:MAG: hypothetical protein K0Q60_1210 [Microvirga sp.]|jgi:hypothetical protein|nr:hypothetical protein [Microvirga sp.]
MAELNVANAEGVLWGEGLAYGTLEGIITKEFTPLEKQDRKDIPIAKVPLRYTISDISIPYEDVFSGVSLDFKLHTWKMDSPDTKPENSSWNQEILQASVSLDGPAIEYLQVNGDVSMHELINRSPNSAIKINIDLEKAIEREVMLRVPFPDYVDRVVLAFRMQVKGTLQIGKR